MYGGVFIYFKSKFQIKTVNSCPGLTTSGDFVLIPSDALHQNNHQFPHWEPDSSTAHTPAGVLNGSTHWQPKHSVCSQSLVFQVELLIITGSPLWLTVHSLSSPYWLLWPTCCTRPSTRVYWWLNDRTSISMNNETKRFRVLTLPRGCLSPEEPVKQSARQKLKMISCCWQVAAQTAPQAQTTVQILCKVHTELCYCGSVGFVFRPNWSLWYLQTLASIKLCRLLWPLTLVHPLSQFFS